MRKMGLILLACGTVLAVLPMGDALAKRDRTAPKIVRAEMLDANGNGLADRVVLNYSEKVKHQLDTDGKYPFQILGPDKASSYKIKKVNATKTTKLVIILRENPNGANKPDIKYVKTKSKPVTDLARNKAKPQVFIKTIGLPLEATEFTLTVNVTGPGKVSSTSSPSQQAQIDCGETCEATYPKDTDVNLSATPLAQGDAFANWAGDCAGTGSACVVPMDANKTVTATFTAGGEMLLTVTKTGAGKVTSNPSGIDCGATCAKGFPKDSSVTLTATPDSLPGTKFIDWTGACSGASTSCTVKMDAAKSVTAKFAYVLTVSAVGGGVVNSDAPNTGIACRSNTPQTCAAGFAPGTSVTLRSIADGQAAFMSWGGQCTGTSATCAITLDANKTVVANFGYEVTVSKAPASNPGNGTVTSTPQGITTCSTTCKAVFAAGQDVTLTASPLADSSFVTWGGACSNTTGPCVINDIAQAKAVTFQFVLKGPFTLTVTPPSAPGTSITSTDGGIACTSLPGADCSEQYTGGVTAHLTASSTNPLFEFQAWTDDCGGATTTCDVFMDANKTVGATFAPPGGGVTPQPMDASKSGAFMATGTTSCAPLPCGSSVVPGAPVTVTAIQTGPLGATPSFTNCPTTPSIDNGTKTATCSFTMPNAPTTINAVFN
jgi:hypothetical protein